MLALKSVPIFAKSLGHVGRMPVPPDDTTDPVEALRARYYMVELRTFDDRRVARLIIGTQSLDRARAAFDAVVADKPLQPVTLRQRARVLRRWPDGQPE